MGSGTGDASQEGYVVVDGARVWYRDSGVLEASPVMLVHGSGANHLWWHAMLPSLRARHRVVEVDLSGHGESDHRRGYSLAGWVAELRAVLATVPAGRATLVGHSMGGKVCVATAAEHSDLVAGLVLFDVALPPPTAWRDRPASMPGRQRYYPSKDELLARFALAPPQPEPPAEVLAVLADGSARREAAGWTWKHDRRNMPILDDRQIGERALRVECPVSFVHAEHSYAVDESVLSHVRAALPAPVTVRRVADAHHHLILEVPEICAGFVSELIGVLR